jgi:hypothetical protein
MAFKIQNFLSPLTLPDPGKGKKNTTDRRVVRKLAGQAAKDSKEGKSTLIETNNSSRSQKGSGKSTTYNSKDGNKKVKKREIKKALKSANVGRGDKVVVDKGEVRIIKKKPLTRDQKIAALKKKKSDELARRAKLKEKKSAKVAAGREALKQKQNTARAERAAFKKKRK